MEKINYKKQWPVVSGQGSDSRGQEFIPHPSSLILRRLLLSLAAALCLTAGPAHALDISDYTAYPPFLPRVTSPNILFMLDYSKSMVRPAYGTCKSVSDYSDAAVVDSTTADTDVSDCRNTFNQIGVGEITLAGMVSVTNGSATVTGTGTQFSTALSAGNTIRIKNVDYTVSSIASTTSLTLSSTYRGTTETGLTVYKVGTLKGTISVINNNNTVGGTGTSFLTELSAGGTIVLKDVPYTISSIASDTSLTLASNYAETTASGFTARKGDSYSKVTPYSGYFDNGYSGSGSYTDASSYKYNCTAATNGTCVKNSSGVWNGNWLNWLTATQFDILKKVAVGGDVNPAPEQAAPTTVRSILTDGYTFRKTMALKEGDTNSNGVLDYCEGKIPDALCKMQPTTPYNLTYDWIDASSGTTVLSSSSSATDIDDSSTSATLPFPFTFYGNTYTTIYISTNGYVGFTNSYMYAYNNQTIPNATSGYPDNIITPFWDDLYIRYDVDSTKNSKVYTYTTGTAPNRIYVVSYDPVYHINDSGKSSPLRFQILLYEGSNHIVFQYKTITGDAAYTKGQSATVGVENSTGTAGKLFSYDTQSLSNSQAVFATPHISFTVTPRSGTTDFQAAAPLNGIKPTDSPPSGLAMSGASPAGYKVDINVNENSSCTSEGVGCYYNKDRAKYYDHPTLGLLQDFRDGELGGTLGFRLGIQQLNATDGGAVTKHFNQKDGMGTGAGGWPSLMNDTRKQTPLTNTPLAEALYEAEGYFSETESWDYGSDWTYDSTSSTCASTGTNYDPYCSQSAAQRVPCCKSFVLLVSSGNYSNDNKTNIYGDADDANGTIPAGALRAIDGGSLTSGTTGEGTKLNGGYLDNVAYKAHTTDWRSDLETTQNLTLYAVNTFGEGSGDGTNILKKAAKYGGFDDTDGDNAYDAGEDDKNSNGVPDTYFEASGGSDLKSKIIDAVTEIMKSSASGTSVSVLSTSAGGEGAIYQAYFYPAKLEGTTDERTWPGFIKSFFLDKKQNLRDDSSGGTYTCSSGSCTYSGTPNAALSATGDKIAQMCLNTTTNEVKVKLFADSNGDYATDTASTSDCPAVTSSGDPKVVSMDDVVSIWEAGKKLALRDKSTRKIYTWVPTSVSATNDEGFSSLSGTPMDFTDDNKTVLSPYLRAQAGDVDGAGTTYNAFAAEKEAEYVIRFIRGEAITPATTSADNTGVSYRNRCVSIVSSTGSDESGCEDSNSDKQRVWALGDIINSTPTLVSGPGEQYDLLYGDSNYTKFRAKYQNRRRMVYVGANDGMLHAFNAGIFNETTTSFSANPSSGDGWSSPLLGDELWAFVPYDNLPHLQWLACNGTSSDPSQCGSSEYTHVYYVDSRPKVTDARIFSNTDSADCPGNGPSTGAVSGQADACHPGGWGTIMIMSMRFGGGAIDVTIGGTNREFRSAYYAFDITDPEKKPKLLWRFGHADLGFTTSYPAIVRMGDKADYGKWYMVVGNGPKNATGLNSGDPLARDYGGKSTSNLSTANKIFVVDLSDVTSVTTFTTGTANEYIGDPLVVDKNFDFESDTIYIGSSINTGSADIDGKVYRINTNGNDTASTTNWNITTLINAGKPVLTAPSVAVDADRNLWVFFGTGRLRNSGDPSDLTNTEQQTFYGIKDGCWEGLTTTSCITTATTRPNDQTNKTYVLTELFNAQATSVKVETGATQVEGVTGITSGECSDGSCSYSDLLSALKSSKKGWYFNLPGYNGTSASERVLSRAAVLGGVVLFTAYKPAASICSIFGDSRLYALNYETGTAYSKAIVGSSSTGIGADASTTGTYISKGIELGKGMPTAVGIAVGEKVTGFVQKSTGEIVRIEAEPGTTVKSGAASWREKTGGGGTSEIETIYKHIVK